MSKPALASPCLTPADSSVEKRTWPLAGEEWEHRAHQANQTPQRPANHLELAQDYHEPPLLPCSLPWRRPLLEGFVLCAAWARRESADEQGIETLGIAPR